MRVFLFLIITLSANPTRHIPAGTYFVIWNVGQGQWATAIKAGACLHFDTGGEYFPWKKISLRCQDRHNLIFLSHWDWDHIGALAQIPKKSPALRKACLAVLPQGSASQRKKSLIKKWPLCPKNLWTESIHHWQPTQSKTSNGKSHVFMFDNILIPGDSTQTEEKIWASMKWVPQSQILLLGHHGSKTSTSQALLKRMSSLKVAISSARWARYRHPHSSVEVNLRLAKTPLLRTEDWGNLWFER